jgi:hypothetical protein
MSFISNTLPNAEEPILHHTEYVNGEAIFVWSNGRIDRLQCTSDTYRQRVQAIQANGGRPLP